MWSGRDDAHDADMTINEEATRPISSESLPKTTEIPGHVATDPPAEPRSSRHGGFVWAAMFATFVAVVALTVATAGGDGAPDEAPRPFDPEAEQLEQDARLAGNAETYLENRAPTTASPDAPVTLSGSPDAIEHRALADEASGPVATPSPDSFESRSADTDGDDAPTGSPDAIEQWATAG